MNAPTYLRRSLKLRAPMSLRRVIGDYFVADGIRFLRTDKRLCDKYGPEFVRMMASLWPVKH